MVNYYGGDEKVMMVEEPPTLAAVREEHLKEGVSTARSGIVCRALMKLGEMPGSIREEGGVEPRN